LTVKFCALFSSFINARNWSMVFFYSARSEAAAEYWKYFTVRFEGVHAFGYNSAESESI